MPIPSIWEFLFAIVMILAALACVRFFNSEKRMRKMAHRLGFRYLGGEKPAGEVLPGFWIWKDCHAPKLSHLMEWDSGPGSILFASFSQITRSKNVNTTIYSRLTVIRLPGLDAPHCAVRPQGTLERFGQAVGICAHMDFATDPEFDRLHVVTAEKEEEARTFLAEPLRRWFVDHHALGVFSVEARGDTILIDEVDLDFTEDFIKSWGRAARLVEVLTGRRFAETVSGPRERALCETVEPFLDAVAGEKVYLFPLIPAGLVDRAKAAFAGGCREGEPVLALVDSTVFGSVKAGILVTGRTVYVKDDFGEPKTIPLEALGAVCAKRELPAHAIHAGEEKLITLNFSGQTVEHLAELLQKLGETARTFADRPQGGSAS